MNDVKALLEALRTDPRAKELLEEVKEPAGIEEAAGLYLDLAEKLGINVSRESMISFLQAKEKYQQAQSAKAAETVKEALEDRELDSVAGGYKEHNECSDTFQDGENCWFTDQCDIVFSHYGTPQNSIDLNYDNMCKDTFDTYEELFGVETW